MRPTRGLGGTKNAAAPPARPVHGALHGDLGHAEGAADVALGGAAVDDQLTGEEAEGGEVGLGVGEDGQVAVEVGDLAVAALEGQGVIQMRGAGREQA